VIITDPERPDVVRVFRVERKDDRNGSRYGFVPIEEHSDADPGTAGDGSVV